MREREIRERIEQVLRTLAMSATMGISVSFAACSQSAAVYEAPLPSLNDAATGPQTSLDAAADFPMAIPLYMALMADAPGPDMAAPDVIPDVTADDSGSDATDRS
jgi:hypothetical protein